MRLKRYNLFKNITLKVLAFIFAVVLWLFVVGERGTEIGFLIPLELKGIPSGFMVINEVSSFIEVRLSGPRTLLTSLSPAQMRVALDLSKSQKGTNTFQILPEEISVPRGVKVTGVRPTSVTIVLDKLITVKLPIKVRTTGSLQKGYRLMEITANPTEASLTGAEEDLKRLKEISTLPLDIDGIASDLVEKVSLELNNLRITKIEPEVVEVSIRVSKS